MLGRYLHIFMIFHNIVKIREINKPLWHFIDNWDIPFESISDLQWLGSGAQGAVFSGKLKNEIVAVKKVREQKETDIRHLRKLNHPNIVQFR